MADNEKASEVIQRIEKYLQDRLKSISIDRSELTQFLTPVMSHTGESAGDNVKLFESLAAIKSGTSQKHVIHNMLTEIGKRCRGCGLILMRTKNPVFWSGPGMGQRLGEPAGSTKIEIAVAADSLIQRAINKMSVVTAKYPGSATELQIYKKLGISPSKTIAILPMAVSGAVQAAVLVDSESEVIDDLAAIAIIVSMSGTFIEQLSFRKWVGYSPMPNITRTKDTFAAAEPFKEEKPWKPEEKQLTELDTFEQVKQLPDLDAFEQEEQLPDLDAFEQEEPEIGLDEQMAQIEMPEELEIEEAPSFDTADDEIPEFEPFYKEKEETLPPHVEEPKEAAASTDFEFETSNDTMEAFETESITEPADPFDEAFPAALGEDETSLPEVEESESEFEFELAGSGNEDTSETEAFPMTDLPAFDSEAPITEESDSFDIDMSEQDEMPALELSSEAEFTTEEADDTTGEITAETEPLEHEGIELDEGPGLEVEPIFPEEEEPAIEESPAIELEEMQAPLEPVEEPVEAKPAAKPSFFEMDSLGYDVEKYDADTKKLHEKAIRFARLLVSEIKLYNEEAVLQGRENNDLAARLKDDITRSKTLYDQRISESVRAQFDYFKEELIRQLAEGDRSQFQ